MSKHRTKRRTPFGELSRKRKKAAYIRVKNDIRRAAPALGGLFYSHDYLHGANGWVDGYFLSARTGIFYNFALSTTRHAYTESVSDAAMEAAEHLVAYDYDWLTRAEKDPVTGFYVSKPRVEAVHEAFGGRTRWEWIKDEERRIADARTIEVREECTLHRDYAFGIGLHATLDVPYLTVATIESFIRSFLERGEKAFAGGLHSFGYDEAGHWGVEANAIVEPWVHPPGSANPSPEAEEGSNEEGG